MAVRDRIEKLFQRRVFRDGMWVATGQVISAGMLLVATRVTTELVPNTAVLGAVGLLIPLLTFVRNIFCTPVLQAQVRLYQDYAGRGEVGKLRQITSALLKRTAGPITAIFLAAGGVYCFRTHQSYWMIVALAGLLVVELIRNYETNFLTTGRRQKAVTAINTADTLARPAFMAVMVLCFGATAQSILMGYLIGTSTVYFLMLIFVHREGTGEKATGFRWSDPVVREIMHYALPLVPLAVVGWITAVSDRFILDWFLGAKKVGIYVQTYGLMSQPFLIAQGIIGRTLMPIYYKAIAEGNTDVEDRSFRAWMAGTIGVCGAGFVGVCFLKKWIARYLLAEQYRPGAELMPWIAAGYTLYTIATIFEARLYARKMTNRILVGNVVVAITSIVAPVIFLYHWGMLGVAMACPVYFGVHVIVMMALARAGRRNAHS